MQVFSIRESVLWFVKVFVFVEVFYVGGNVLYLWKCFVPMSHCIFQLTIFRFWHIFVHAFCRSFDLKLPCVFQRAHRRGRGGRGPPFFLVFSKCFWNVNVTLLLHVRIRGGGWGSRHPLSEFSGSAPGACHVIVFLAETECNWKNKEKQIMFGFKKLLSDNKTETPWLPWQMNDQWHIVQRRNHCRELEGVESRGGGVSKYSLLRSRC